MGVSATHYIVLGVALTNKEQIKEFFEISDEHEAVLDEYDDNAYSDEITENTTGIHIIADGMSSKYVVIGKILQKSNYGFDLNETSSLPVAGLVSEEAKEVYAKIIEIDRNFHTKFGLLDLKYLIFTHFH